MTTPVVTEKVSLKKKKKVQTCHPCNSSKAGVLPRVFRLDDLRLSLFFPFLFLSYIFYRIIVFEKKKKNIRKFVFNGRIFLLIIILQNDVESLDALLNYHYHRSFNGPHISPSTPSSTTSTSHTHRIPYTLSI